MIYNAIVAANLSPPPKLPENAHLGCQMTAGGTVYLFVSHEKPLMLSCFAC